MRINFSLSLSLAFALALAYRLLLTTLLDEHAALPCHETPLISLAGSLRAIIEPDYGVLDVLLGREALSVEQYDVIRSSAVSVYQRNDRLLEYAARDGDGSAALTDALRLTDQQHVVNFISLRQRHDAVDHHRLKGIVRSSSSYHILASPVSVMKMMMMMMMMMEAWLTR